MSTIIKHQVHTHLSLHREGGEANFSPAKLPGCQGGAPRLISLALRLGGLQLASEGWQVTQDPRESKRRQGARRVEAGFQALFCTKQESLLIFFIWSPRLAVLPITRAWVPPQCSPS